MATAQGPSSRAAGLNVHHCRQDPQGILHLQHGPSQRCVRGAGNPATAELQAQVHNYTTCWRRRHRPHPYYTQRRPQYLTVCDRSFSRPIVGR